MKDRLDRLVEAFLLAEVGDLQGLKILRHRLDELLPSAADSGVVEALVDLGSALDLLVAGKDPDPEGTWASLGRSLQQVQERVAAAALPETTAPSEGGAPERSPIAMDREILSGFVVEAREHLESAEAELLSLETGPEPVDAIHTVFRAFHTIKGAAACLDLGAIQELAHETESLLDLARRGTLRISGVALDLVFEAVDAMKRLVSGLELQLSSGTSAPADPALAPLMRRLRRTAEDPEKGATESSDEPALPALEAVEDLPPSGEPSAPGEAAAVPAADEKAAVKESVRVDADRLDRLVDLIGELVIAESMVSQSAEWRELAAGGVLSKSVSQLDKITRELQEIGMSLRMVPVRPLFRKMARLARDTSRKLGKPIEFATAGEEIEIDKAIVNCVADALVHIVRNAVDHGIEADAADRRRAGKPEAGRLELRAAHREGAIVIEVEDDGAGLDRDAVLAKGIEKGLVPAGASLSDEDVFRLIFLPGFSTAKVVTELSGRGVGLDVVRTSVEALRGRIEVQSRPGRGTVFRLRLPLTLAIIDGMVIRAGAERFIVPTLSITRLVQPEAVEQGTALGKGEMLSLQDEVVPLFRLRNLLGIRADLDAAAPKVVVVVEDAGRRAGLMADEVLGQQQIVIKSLGLNLEGVPGISGGVILPDGQVGLILDVPALLLASRSAADAAAPAGVGGSR
jgi:two-component system chemotaxis sensor kinase CheA